MYSSSSPLDFQSRSFSSSLHRSSKLFLKGVFANSTFPFAFFFSAAPVHSDTYLYFAHALGDAKADGDQQDFAHHVLGAGEVARVFAACANPAGAAWKNLFVFVRLGCAPDPDRTYIVDFYFGLEAFESAPAASAISQVHIS